MEEAKGFQPSRAAAQQVSRVLREIIWLRFVHFQYHLPLPNPEQPSLRGKLPEQIPSSLSVSPLGLSGTWWETCFFYSSYCGLPHSQQRRKGTEIMPIFPWEPQAHSFLPMNCSRMGRPLHFKWCHHFQSRGFEMRKCPLWLVLWFSLNHESEVTSEGYQR